MGSEGGRIPVEKLWALEAGAGFSFLTQPLVTSGRWESPLISARFFIYKNGKL